MNNYCIIAASVEPIKDPKINLIPRSWSDIKDICEAIKHTNFSSNLKLVLISLFSFIVIAFIIWYILVSIIFRKASDFLPTNKYGWKNTKELEEAIERNKNYLRDLKENN